MRNRMTKKQKAEARAKAIETLREYLPVGSKLYTLVTGVARSGMSREIVCMVTFTDDRDGSPCLYNISYLVASALGYRRGDRGVKVEGCGMDMGFHVANSLSYALHGTSEEAYVQSIMEEKGVNRGMAQARATNEDYRPGYTIKHSWV